MNWNRLQHSIDPDALRFDEEGLLPVVAQDAFTGRVLMLAWANDEAVRKTLATGEAHFWSRSRQRLWRKGETSGNVLRVTAMERDCDGDSLLLRVLPAGPACHTGSTSCFDAQVGAAECGLDLGALERIIADRAGADPEQSYTARLFDQGIERMAQKVGEEATEVVIAALARGGRQRLVEEASDLIFHLMILLKASGVSTADLASELSARHQRNPLRENGASIPLPKNRGPERKTGSERSESEQDDQDPERIGR